MKKILALVLVLSMVLGSFGFAFAATPAQANAGQMLKDLGVLKGDAQGDLMLDSVLKRQDIIVLLSRLMGAEEEASKFPIPTAFADVTDAYYKPFIGWAQVEGLTNGIGDNKFGFDQELTVKELSTMLLRALGHEGAHAWDNAEKLAVELGLVATGADFAGAASRAVMAEATLGALKAPVTGDSKQSLGTKLGFTGFELVAELAVKSVKANTAKSFQVEFTTAVEDTTKVEFTVKRGSTNATLTTTWNEEKTVATLTAAAKLAEGIYTITVGEFGDNKVEIEREKVATVEFSSDEIIRVNDHKGVVGFVVRNQYGDDITNSALGRALEPVASTTALDETTGAVITGANVTADWKAGFITFQHGHPKSYMNQLKDLPAVVLTMRDTTTGFVQTKSFGVSDTIAAIADVKLLGVVDENGNSVDLINDNAKTYYLDFEVFDAHGNKVTYAKALLESLHGQNILDVKSTNETLIFARAEGHPNNNSQLVYRLELGTNASTMNFDTPITFMAIAPYSGKTSTLTTTLFRKSVIESFAMQAPAETVSENRSVEIPFTAFDQNGEAITKYDDLVRTDSNNLPLIQFSGGSDVRFVRQPDGSAKLYAKFENNAGVKSQLHYLTATVRNSLKGSFTQVGINVREAAKPESIEALKHTRAFVTYGTGADMKASWGRALSDFTVRDQFDRAINLRYSSAATGYTLEVTTSDARIVDVTAANGATRSQALGSNVATVTLRGYNEDSVNFVSGGNADANIGTATITYTLKDSQGKTVDTVSTLVHNVKHDTIKSVKMTAEHDKEIFTTSLSTIYRGQNVAANTNNSYTLVGVTSTGLEVRLPKTMFVNMTSSDDRFAVDQSAKKVTVASIGNATTATTTVTGYVYGSDRVLSASTTLKANTVAPIAQAVTVNYEAAFRRAADIDNDIITINATNFQTFFATTKSVYAFDVNGASMNSVRAGLQFRVNTQYGDVNNGVLNRIVVTQNNGNGTFAINSTDGMVTANAVQHGDEYTVEAIASNGIVKTIIIRIDNNL